jgi:ketosteroid isomerase-like protein
MRRAAAGLAIAILLASVVIALAQTGTGKAGGADAAVLERMKQVMAAWATLDPGKAAPFYAKNPELVFFDVAPVKYTGWSEYEEGTRKVFADFASLAATVSNPAAHVEGKLAWTTAEIMMTPTMKDGTPLPLQVRWTAIWEKRGNDWLIVHEHVSTPLAMPGEAATPPKH